MTPGTRFIERLFTAACYGALAVMVAALLLLLVPIFVKGMGALVFHGTVEYRRMRHELFDRGDGAQLAREQAQMQRAAQPMYAMLAEFEAALPTNPPAVRATQAAALRDLQQRLRVLLGPLPGEPQPALPRSQYGQTRWDRAQVKLHEVLYAEVWDYSNPDTMGQKMEVPRQEQFAGTALAPLFPFLQQHTRAILQPRLTCYWRFFTDASRDAHFFGGIKPELVGTLYLTLGAVLLAVPFGVLSAIYLVEFARDGLLVRVLRMCMNTLAGVPSIVFGLFGLACFINTMHVSPSKSVLAGSLTLALLILPTIIRAAEEALRAVPMTYREAAISLGATPWYAVISTVVPAALPGILTGVVISMGRAAGETAPIIFTAAVSVGQTLRIWDVLTQPTPVLSWNIYNVATEHEAVDEIRHVQFGMVLALVALVLLLNGAAIILRARMARALKG
ncbi:MAG: phosphate ABC transporter permease PstA [bacterium]|nr:phosphate ABC transporter permease PstA [bacterium]